MTGILLARAWFQLAPADFNDFEARIAPFNALSNGKPPSPEPEGDRRRPHAGRAVGDVDLGPLSKPTTAALRGRRELVFMPLKRPCRRVEGPVQLGRKVLVSAVSWRVVRWGTSGVLIPAVNVCRSSRFVEPDGVLPPDVVDAEIVGGVEALDVVVPDVVDLLPGDRQNRRVLFHDLLGLAHQR
jgi:hypothetical protein